MKIAILGGSGFVGSNLARSLEKVDRQLFPLSRNTGFDLMNFPLVLGTFKRVQPDAIFNLAAHFGSLRYLKKFAADILHDNTQMVLNVYRAAAEACPDARIINPLSNCSYPGNTDIQKESDWLKGEVHDSVFSYGNAKRFIYITARCYKTQYGVRSINFVVPNVFGPGDCTDTERVHALNGIIIRMIKAHRNRDSQFEIWGTGEPVREWLYIDDLVTILERGLKVEEGLTYPVNIAQNRGHSIRESGEIVAKAIGFKGDLIFNTDYPDGDPKKVMDDTLFRKLFPDFSFSDHAYGVQKTVEYYLSVL